MGQQRSCPRQTTGSGQWHGVSLLDRTEDTATSLVGGSPAGDAYTHLGKASAGDHRPLSLPRSLCSQVWPTELSTTMWMPCVTCVSSSTSCPSATRTQLPSASAMTPGGWQLFCPSLAFCPLCPDRIPGQIGAGHGVCRHGHSCGEDASGNSDR